LGRGHETDSCGKGSWQVMVGGKSAKALWQDYRFLTKEMIKFLAKQDMELFNELMNQRERLQTMLNQVNDDGFKDSTEGQTILAEVQQDNQSIIDNVQVLLSQSKRQHQVSQAYSAASTTAVSLMSWKR